MERCPRRTAVLAAALSLGAAAASPAAELPDPAAPESHRAFVEYLKGGEDRVFRQLRARYDAYLAGHPEDVAAHVERCRFLAEASCDEEGECPYWEEHERCVAELEEEFPTARTVDLYRLERSWGEEGIRIGTSLLEGRARGWRPVDLAQVHEKLARVYGARKAFDLVLPHALRALELDPTLDHAILAARALQSRGERARAVEVLVATTGPREYWAQRQQADLLAQLGAYTEAALVLEQLASPPPGAEPDYLLSARVWFRVGHVDQAREALVRASESAAFEWRTEEIAEQRFQLELAHGDARSALAAYESLRDTGFTADPLLRSRLRLAFRHPSAAWRARDALGVLAILGVFALTALAPGILLIPVHYIGLVRARAHPERILANTRFGLRQSWYVLAVLFVSELPLLYVDGLAEAVGWTDALEERAAPAGPPQPLPERELALGSIGGSALALAGVAALFRRRDAAMLGRGAWTRRRTLFAAVTALVGLRLLLTGWMLLFPELTDAPLDPRAPNSPPAPLITQAGFAIARTYGLPALFLYLVVAIPLCEELAFRGVLLQGFHRYLGFGWANGLQALLFASLHESWQIWPFYFAIGWVGGSFARRSGTLAAPLLLHAANNGLAFASIAQGLGAG